MKRNLSRAELIAVMRDEIDAIGSMRKAAKKWGVSAAFLCDVLKNNRPVGHTVPTSLGYEVVVTYRRINEESTER